MSDALRGLKDRLADVNALQAAAALMDWDHQCFMPSGGTPARAEHLGILTRMAHEAFVADETQRLLQDSHGEAETNEDRAMLRVVQREMDQKTKIPASLVAEKTRLGSLAHEIWVKARQDKDFASFAPALEQMFDITRQEAEHLGYTDHIYDALVDLYEEGATHADCVRMYETLKGPNVELVAALNAAEKPDDSFLYGDWDVATQRAFTETLIRAIGFDMERGRQDTAAHPFCTGFSVGDIRLTTRFKSYLPSAIFGSLHEAGHGMYEQGSPMAWDRTPLAGGVSMGFHESQSRTWENLVGRSHSFWSYFYPKLQASFPALASVGLETFYKAVNKVESSFIRVEADEVTYNLHTLVRFELESAVLEGSLAVKDLPAAWNDKYEAYLGIRPTDDSVGVLQDVHWSAGLIGYFPTYTMGNLLSYQIWNTMLQSVPDADAQIGAGKFEEVHGWLRDNLYRLGRSVPPKELALKLTGKPMGAEDYVAGLSAKYRGVYGL